MLRGFLWLCDLLKPHDSALTVPHPHDGIARSAPRSPSKSRDDPERTQTSDLQTDLFPTSCCAPHRQRGRNPSSESVATRGCKRDIVRDGTVATGVPHSLMGDACSFGTVESRDATRRCLILRGTASPDAVPQRHACRSPSPHKSSMPVPKLLRHLLFSRFGEFPLETLAYPLPHDPFYYAASPTFSVW